MDTQTRADEMVADYASRMRVSARQKLAAQIQDAIKQLMVLQDQGWDQSRSNRMAALMETLRMVRQDVDDLSAIIY